MVDEYIPANPDKKSEIGVKGYKNSCTPVQLCAGYFTDPFLDLVNIRGSIGFGRQPDSA